MDTRSPLAVSVRSRFPIEIHIVVKRVEGKTKRVEGSHARLLCGRATRSITIIRYYIDNITSIVSRTRRSSPFKISRVDHELLPLLLKDKINIRMDLCVFTEYCNRSLFHLTPRALSNKTEHQFKYVAPPDGDVANHVKQKRLVISALPTVTASTRLRS